MKVLTPGNDAQAATEFDGEGELLCKLSGCTSVINWIESGSESLSVSVNGVAVPLPFKYHILAMASGALEELIVDPTRRQALPWGERLNHWRGAVKGVHQMHLNMVAHRDLKSSNCLLMVQKGNSEVRLADLGRSKDFANPPSLPEIEYISGRGDLRYAPPEHLWFQGGSTAADFRNADLYGLGSLLVELATGHPMTALAVGSWQDARSEGQRDFLSGHRRDLGTLRPRFSRAIEELGGELPPVIRHESIALLKQLCDPVPAQRQPRPPHGKRVAPDPGLAWLLRRADILGRRLNVSSRRPIYRSNKNAHRSAS